MELTTDDRKALQGAMNVLAEILQQSPPEVPERVEEWPEDDEHLRGDCWKSPWGSILLYRDGKWRWWNSWDRTWPLQATPGLWTPLERIADPTEVPDTIEEWPTDDEHLQGEFWKDRQGDVITYTGGGWMFWVEGKGQWALLPMKPDYYLPFTRTTDPSLPRTWGTLDAVDADVERVTGDYLGTRRELARSPLSESGWFERLKDGVFRNWAELPTDHAKHVTNIREEQ